MGLIMLSAASKQRIIVPTPDEAKSIARQARAMGLRIPYPVAFCELPRQARPNGEVLVDESLSIKPVDVMAVHGSLRKANPAMLLADDRCGEFAGTTGQGEGQQSFMEVGE